MFNRHLYQKLQSQVNHKKQQLKKYKQSQQTRKSITLKSVTNYKTKVRNFLVELASNPIELGSYQPPIVDIVRQQDEISHRLGASQMFINGFKTNRQRIQKIQEDNKIIDNTPVKYSHLNHVFRDRVATKQIQPQMHYAQKPTRAFSLINFSKVSKSSTNLKSSSVTKLPSIKGMPSINPQQKTYFKALQQMGNSLKTMKQSSLERLGLSNRLMTVYDGKQVDIQQTTMDILANCKLLRKRIHAERQFKSIQSERLHR